MRICFWTMFGKCLIIIIRLIDVAGHYYDMKNFPPGETKRILEKIVQRRELAKMNRSGISLNPGK